MQCTKCSSPVRPIVTFDIDGTMGDYHNHFCYFAAQYLGYAHYESNYDGLGHFREWFCDEYNVDVRTFRDIKLAYRQGGQKRSMPVSGWARSAVQVARQAGAEVWITTTRPYMRLDNIDPDTRFWLQRHGIKYDHLIYGDHKYEDLANQVDPERICFLIDDLAEQIDKAIKVFNPAACNLYKTRWNRIYHSKYAGFTNGEAITLNVDKEVKAWMNERSSLV